MNVVGQALRDEPGATIIEYSILLALIAAVRFVAVATLGLRVHGVYSQYRSFRSTAFNAGL